ncbi:MAG: hypothetical protein KKE86_01355 [Planctomycetes bacterium]|nr:hypothetical protein [Planctomycetota bacterium]MCG2684536.1 hypothetical protein [Planctomycetales bacterium]
MVATAFATQRRTGSNVAADELVFRVFGPTRDGRIVRLKSHKCTIGAGKHCSLRLRAPGVAPLHCLVVRGRAGAVVRRWAADTLLNHQAFDDAPLSPGDRLSVGPVELEVLGVGADPQQPPETSHSDDSARLAELETQRRSLEQQRRQWQIEQEDTRRKLDEQLAQLTAQAAELEAQRNALAEQRRQWETEREHSTTQATAQTEQLQTRLAELETQRRSLEQQRRQWQAEQKDTRRKLDEQLAQLTAQTADLEAQRNALAEQRRQWEAEREQHPAAEGYRSEESTPGNEPQAETSDAAGGGETSPTSKTQELEFQTPQKQSPVDLADVFRRVGAKIDFPEAEADAADKPQAKPPAAAAKNGKEEESIEEYMNRLMQRVQASSGGSAAPFYTPPASAPAAARRAPAAAVVETMEPSSTAPAPAPQRREPAQVAPRAEAPEKHANLSAMRELANLSAQNALNRYSRRILVNAMYSKLLVVAVALAAAAGLLWMWKTTTGWQTTFYSALVALIVAVYWGVQYALLSGRLMINKSGHIKWHSSAGYGNGASKTAESNAEKSSGETASGTRTPNPDPRTPI